MINNYLQYLNHDNLILRNDISEVQ